MKNLNLAYVLVGCFWAYVLSQACGLQFDDEQRLQAYQTNSCSLEQELKLDAEKLQVVDSVAAKIVLETLRNVQRVKQEIVLDDINISQ